MTVKKHIAFFLLVILFPLFLFAQKVETRKYILSSGDTVRIINKSKIGILSKDEASFLSRDTAKLKTFADMKPKYSSLEEAAYDVTRLLQEVEATQAQQKQTNTGLGVRIAAYNREKQNKEKKAIDTANDILSTEKSLEELTALYVMFGNKPTYYINGIEVSESQVTKLSTADKATRNLVSINPVSGNPNGEVWYNVSEEVFRKLKIQATTTKTGATDKPAVPTIIKEIIVIEEDIIENTPTPVSQEKLTTPPSTRRNEIPLVQLDPPAKPTITTQAEKIQPKVSKKTEEVELAPTSIIEEKQPVSQKKTKKTIQRMNGNNYGSEEEVIEDDEPIDTPKTDTKPNTVVSTKKSVQPPSPQVTKPFTISEEEVIEKDTPAYMPQMPLEKKVNTEEKKAAPTKEAKKSVRKIKEKHNNN